MGTSDNVVIAHSSPYSPHYEELTIAEVVHQFPTELPNAEGLVMLLIMVGLILHTIAPRFQELDYYLRVLIGEHRYK